jgi:hypothetical protein
MKSRFFYLVGMAAVLGLATFNAAAATVQFSTPNPISVLPNQNLTLELFGTGFSTKAQGGGFSVQWDPAVLTFQSITFDNTPWDTPATDDSHAGLGRLNSVLIGTSGAATGPDFKIATFGFKAAGNIGASTPIELADVFGGWADSSAGVIPGVSYVNAQIKVVPVPPALLLFGSWLLGFGFLAKKSPKPPTV